MPFVNRTPAIAEHTLTAFAVLFGLISVWSWASYWLGAGATGDAATALMFTVASVATFGLSMGVERLRNRGD